MVPVLMFMPNSVMHAQAVRDIFPQVKNCADDITSMAYKAADEGGDGWIGLQEFRALLRYVVFLHSVWRSYTEIRDAAGEELSLHHVMAGVVLWYHFAPRYILPLSK